MLKYLDVGFHRNKLLADQYLRNLCHGIWNKAWFDGGVGKVGGAANAYLISMGLINDVVGAGAGGFSPRIQENEAGKSSSVNNCSFQTDGMTRNWVYC